MSLREARRLGLLEAAARGEVTNVQVAQALALSVRQVRRLRRRIERQGAQALIHGNRGRASTKRLAEPIRQRVEGLLQDLEAKLNDTHVADLLAEEGLQVSADTVGRIRTALGCPPRQRHRARQHRRRRERHPRAGSLILVDGSPFRWWADAPEYTLVGAIDDATGAILSLVFRPEEDLHGYAQVFQQVFLEFGLPVAVYGDRTGILRRHDTHWSIDEQLEGRQRATQGGRMLEELGIAYIPAQSPQAKGRIERLWRTLQDRLTQELRLHRHRTLTTAEAFLPEFIRRFNHRFARSPRETLAAWRRPPRQLDRVLACSYRRVVRNDNVVTLSGRWLQIPPGPRGRAYQGRTVEVRELLDGRLLALLDGAVIAEQPAPLDRFTLIPRGGHWRDRRRSNEIHRLDVAAPRLLPQRSPIATPRPERPRWRPPENHPYNRLRHPEACDHHNPVRTRTKSLRS